MINLLPPSYKEELMEEEKYRLTLILWALFLLFLTSLSLIFMAINIYLAGQLQIQKTLVEAEEKEFNTPELKAFEKKISSINQNFSGLNSFYQKQIKFSQFFEKLPRTLPDGVYLTGISLSLPKEQPATEGGKTPAEQQKYNFDVSLAGFAPTREVLYQFKNNLEAEVSFQEVSFPFTSWVEEFNIKFNSTFRVKQPQI